MFKFMRRGHGRYREPESRTKLKKELFAFNKCVDHGFPNKPSALAHDPKLNLVAIGTKNGIIKVLGGAGVEFSASHSGDVGVTQLYFLPDQGRLVTLTTDNTLHLWEINLKDGQSVMEQVKVFDQFAQEGSKLKTISSVCLTSNSEQLLLGTEGGHIHLLDVNTFTLLDHIIYQDVVMQNVSDDFKVNPGPVEAIAEHPTDSNKFLIGYNRGLIVLWDNKESNADQTYNATQQLESLSWHRDGTQFMSAHADGSYIIWASDDSTKPKVQPTVPYGPFPCKAINKVDWATAKSDPFIIFAGGMPRASYGERHTISVMQGDSHVVFDFTSRIVDYTVLCSSKEKSDDELESEFDDPHTLLVLAEEEVVAIDLESEGWPTFRQPYMCSMHSSAITASQHVSNIPNQLWDKIVDAGNAQLSKQSEREWPITGGRNLDESPSSKDLLLTGHEDGTVRFWDASGVSMSLLYKLSTASLFSGEHNLGDTTANDGDEEWPPFRKVGTFDPYSDDPRLGLQKITLCPISEVLAVAGTAGQVIVMQMEREERSHDVPCATVNVVTDCDSFVWKGHEALSPQEGEQTFAAGFQPLSVMQLSPPAACTALAAHSEWQLVAAGTAYGFVLFDYQQKKEVVTKCTLNPHDLTGAGEPAIARGKSFKKSLRESFRRMRKRMSGRQQHQQAATPAAAAETPKEETPKPDAAETPENKDAGAEAAAPPSPTPAPAEPEVVPEEKTRTVERPVEARTPSDAMASMVRCVYFTDTFLLNATTHTASLWAGTNAGTIFLYAISLPANDKRESEAVGCQLAKEIHLKHHAPVISIGVIDRNYAPLPDALEVEHERAKAPDMTGNHRLVICSEEQFKIFTLPSLKAEEKWKLTAKEGARVRKIGFTTFRSRSDENYSENVISCLTNQGDCNVYSIRGLRQQVSYKCIRKDDISGVSSCVFTKNGQGFYLSSPSEFTHFSLSARNVTVPLCCLELKEGMRPPPPEPEAEPEPEPVPAEEETKTEDVEKPADVTTEEVTEEVAKVTLDDTTTSSNADTSLQDTSANITVDTITEYVDEEGEPKEEAAEEVSSPPAEESTPAEPPAEDQSSAIPDDEKLPQTTDVSKSDSEKLEESAAAIVSVEPVVEVKSDNTTETESSPQSEETPEPESQAAEDTPRAEVTEKSDENSEKPVENEVSDTKPDKKPESDEGSKVESEVAGTTGDNTDDDTKAAGESAVEKTDVPAENGDSGDTPGTTSETAPPSEELEELKITEEGDDATPPAPTKNKKKKKKGKK